MPPVLLALCDRLVRWKVLPPTRRPDTAIINIYETGARAHATLAARLMFRPRCCHLLEMSRIASPDM